VNFQISSDLSFHPGVFTLSPSYYPEKHTTSQFPDLLIPSARQYISILFKPFFMQKILSFLLLLSICFLFHGNTVSGTSSKHPSQSNALVMFSWYNDINYLDFTGSVTTISNEIERLRSTYPGVVFKTYPDIGFYPFEYGYFTPSITSVIYSNW
jgi:hypothetical protein